MRALSKRGFVRVLGVLALYAVLVVWLTWPLTAHVDTHLPSPHPENLFDVQYMVWVLAYESHALTTAPSRFKDANIFYPARGTLFYGDTGFGALPYFFPVFLLTGNPALALNLTVFGSIVLTAAALHLVVAYWTASELAGVVAATAMLFNRWVLWDFIPPSPSFAVLQYFPPIILLAAASASRRRGALGLLPLVVLQSLTDVVYVATALLAPLAVLALVRLFPRQTRAEGLRLLAVLGLAVLALVPIYAEHHAVVAANPHLAAQTNYPDIWQPLTRLPCGLLGVCAAMAEPMSVPLAAFVLIGVGALSLGLGESPAVRPLRQLWAHGALWAGLGIIISLTPTVEWHGRRIALPHQVVADWVPMYRYLRVPSRLGIAALFGLALLSGAAFAECARRLSSARQRPRLARLGPAALAAVVVSAMYAEYGHGLRAPVARPPLPAAYPLAQATLTDSPVMAILRRPGGPVLHLPVGPLGGVLPIFHARAMYRSISHWRPLLNCYSSYWPPGFAERMALANALPDPAALAQLRRETGLTHLLVETALIHPGRDVWLRLADAGGREDLALLARDGDGLLLFEVRAAGLHKGDSQAPN